MLVSVIIPTYNTKKELLRKTLDSVLYQDYSNLEIIVVDDGSKEPFSGLDKEYKNRRIIWHRLNKNSGPAYARNVGVEISSGELIAFLDAGDLWDRTKISRQVKLYKSLSIPTVIYCGTRIKINNRERILLPKHKGDIFKTLLVKNVITGSSCSVLLSKEMFFEVGGFYTEKDIPEDWDLWIRLARKFFFDYINEPLVTLVWLPHSRSYDTFKKMYTYMTFLCRHKEDLYNNGLLIHAFSNYFNNMSILFRRQSNYKMAFCFSLAGFSLQPSMRGIAKVFASFLGYLTKKNLIDLFLSMKK